MDPFSRAGDFYSDAFRAQSAAASMQKTSQRRGMSDTAYNQELEDNPYGSPMVPQSGRYGVHKEESQGTSDFIEDMKRDMLMRAAAARTENQERQSVRAGNGAVTPSMS